MDRLTFVSCVLAASAPPFVSLSATAAMPFDGEEAQGQGRLGVCAIDLRDQRRLTRRENERFPLASTFKLPLVMAVLTRVDRRAERLDRRLRFTVAEILPYSPLVAQSPHGGSLPIARLCAAAIQQSDNTAANLLLETIGGPAALTAYLRGIGDPVTRLDRNEPALNQATPGDVRDTTSPLAMARVLQRLVTEPILSPASKALLFTWLRGTTTGLTRIRAGVPDGWSTGDKTGTTNTGANDVAILWPRQGAPIVLAVYFAEVRASDTARDAAIASVARTTVRTLRGRRIGRSPNAKGSAEG